MKKLIIAALFCLSPIVASNSFAQGIPTYDNSAFLQMGKQIIESQKQLEQLKSQLTEMKNIYGSLNGLTDISSIQDMLNNQAIRGALPSNFNAFEKLLNGEGGNASAWDEKLNYKVPSGGAGSKQAADDFYNKEVEKAKKKNQGQAATAQGVYESATETQKTIEKLADKLKTAQTAKETQDIQAQLAALQATLQTQVLQMQATAMLQQAQVDAANLRADEEWKNRYSDYAKQLLGE